MKLTVRCLVLLFPLYLFGQDIGISETLNKIAIEQNPDSVKSYLDFVKEEIGKWELNDQLIEEVIHSIDQLSKGRSTAHTTAFLEEILKGDNSIRTTNPIAQLKFSYQLGLNYYNQRVYQKADSIFSNIIKATKLEDDEFIKLLGKTYYHKGLTNRRLKNYKMALEDFENSKVSRSRLSNSDPNDIAQSIYWMGRISKDLGNFDDAINLYKKSIAIRENIYGRYHKNTIDSYGNMGISYRAIGNYNKALECYEIVLEILGTSDADKMRAAITYNNMGILLKQNSAFNDALIYYDKAYEIYSDILAPGSEEIGKLFKNQAIIYQRLNLMPESLDKAFAALNIFKDLYGEDDEEVALMYNNIGITYYEMGQYDTSIEYLLKALKTYSSRENMDRSRQATIYNSLGQTYTVQKNYPEALAYHHKAIQIHKELYGDQHPMLAFSYNEMAMIHIGLGDLSVALDYLDQAILTNQKINPSIKVNPANVAKYDFLFESFMLKGGIYEDLDGRENLLKAREQYQTAKEIITYQRNTLFDKSDKITLAQNAKHLSIRQIGNCMALHENTGEPDWLDLAYQSSELSKSLVLRQSLEANKAKQFAGIPDSLLEVSDHLQAKINFYTNQANLATDPENKTDLQSTLFDNRQQYKALQATLEQDYPVYHRLRYQEKSPVLESIQELIREDETIISYSMDEENIYRFTIQSGDIRLDHIQIDDKEIKDHILGLRKSITLDLDDVFLEKARILYDLLIPTDIPSDISKLIIIPDAGLAQIPFETLLTENGSDPGENPGNWPYLIKNFEIHYSPSIALWYDLNQRTTPTIKSGLLAFAPVFTKNEIASEVPNENRLTSSPEYEKIHDKASPLLSSAYEVHQLDSLFKNQNLSTSTYMYEESSEQSLMSEELNDYDYIHFATHGFVNEINPDLSGLLLAKGTSSTADNILYSGEVYNLKLDAQLVSLSACETGLGKIAEGEGILGFSQAFLHAGSRNLLYSLWKVNDQSTADLMIDFYKYALEERGSLSYSLHRAKLDMINSEYYNHPYYWAPFILSGR